MRHGSSFLGVICMMVMTLTACQKQESQEKLDKDEVQGVIVAQELSNSRVQCIAEDASGQLWVGTFRGLNRYDGHEYHQYLCTDDSLGLPDNQIKDILCDRQGRLWVATVNGVCRYNHMDAFDRITVGSPNLNTQKLLEDSKGRVYVYNGTDVLCFNEAKQAFLPCISREMGKQQWAWGNCIIDASDQILITESQRILVYDSSTNKLKREIPLGDHYYFYSEMLSNGLMILSGYGHLTLYDTKSQRIVPISQDMESRMMAHNSIIQAARLLEDNTILLSTSHNGMFELNLLAQSLHGQGDADFTRPVPDAMVTQVFQDSRKNVWLGTYDKGLFADYYYKEKFGGSDNYLNRVIDNSSVLAVAMDQQQDLWISTLLKGLFVYHLNTQQAEAVPLEGLPSGEQKNAVTHIFCDRDGLLWLSTPSLIIKCNYTGDRLNILNQWAFMAPMDFEQTDDGTVWVSTSSNDIIGFPKGASQPIVKQAFNADFCFIPSLLRLNDGQMLISAFYQKILRMNPQTGKFSELDIPSMAQCIRRSVYIPTDMLQDSKGDVWIGTVSNGLMRYNLKTNEMTRIAGLSCSDVGSIEEDRQGNLWIGTMKGLNRWDRKTGRITSLYKADGIGGDEFVDRASCQLPNGSLVFGSTDGITMFNPADIDTLQSIPLMFSDLKIHNQLIRPSADGPINAVLDSCEEVRLDYNASENTNAYIIIISSMVSTITGLTQAMIIGPAMPICLRVNTPCG